MTKQPPVKILREDEAMLTVFQMIDLWEEGCRCPARAVGLSEDEREREEQAQALVTGILVVPGCVVHDPEHANAGGWSGGKVEGVMAATIGNVNVLLPSFSASMPATEGGLARLARRIRQILPKRTQ